MPTTAALPLELLARLLAAIETPEDLNDHERGELIEDAAPYFPNEDDAARPAPADLLAAVRADFAAVLDMQGIESTDEVLRAVAEALDCLPAYEEARVAPLLAAAREAGADHGRAAASWYFDGNTPRAAYERTLQGIEEGDPQVLDTLPSCPLSGEYADGPTPATVLEELGVAEDDDAAGDLLTAYEDAFHEASAWAIEEAARYQLGREHDPRGFDFVEDAGELPELPAGWASCGACGRAWNDATPTAWTPTPAGRCPFEDQHAEEDPA